MPGVTLDLQNADPNQETTVSLQPDGTTMATTVQSLGSITIFTYAPMLILSGAVGKLSLPQWVNTLMTYFPVQPVIQSVSRALGSSSGGLPLISVRDLAVLAAWAAGCLALSVRFFRWDPHRPRHARAAGAANHDRSG
jgi:hypothetical protein